MAHRPSIWRALRWDLLLLAGLMAAVGLYLALRTPHLQRADEATTDGSRPPDRTEGDILLLLPDVPAAEAQAFGELDCSYGWFNALWQKFGSFATAMNRNLSPEILAGRSVVIVPRRVAEAMPSTGVSALASFVRDGGQLVIEQPGEGWEQLTGVSASKKSRPAQRITSTEGLGVHGPMRKHLPNVPLIGALELAPQADTWPNGPTLIEVDGQPGLLLQEQDQGRVYTLLFDFGCTVTGMQQGIPTRGMKLGLEGDEGLQPTANRVTLERLKTSRVPYADLLESALLHHFSRKRPLPRLWPFPGTHAGALLLLHPALSNTRAAIGYADWSRKREGASTIFVPADRVNASQIALLSEADADVGLTWVRGVSRPPVTRTLGLGGLKPLAQEDALAEQLDALAALTGAGDDPIHITHVEGTLWQPDWSTTFEQLSAAHVRLDTSFGPTGDEVRGYMFGTGFPYYPLDERGLPLPLLELPFVLHEASLTPERLRQFLLNSQSYFHQAIAVRLPAHTMRTHPSAGALMGLRDAHQLAREHDHWVTTSRELLEFLYARRRSVLTSQWSEASRRLTITVNLLGSTSRALEQGAFPGIAFPRTYRGDEISRVILDGKPIPLRQLATSGPSFERVLAVGPGRHTISVYYEPPAPSEEP